MSALTSIISILCLACVNVIIPVTSQAYSRQSAFHDYSALPGSSGSPFPISDSRTRSSSANSHLQLRDSQSSTSPIIIHSLVNHNGDSFNFLGCFGKDPSFLSSEIYFYLPDLTPAYCSDVCKDYTYFGLHSGISWTAPLPNNTDLK